MDLDLWGWFGRKKLCLITEEMWYLKTGRLVNRHIQMVVGTEILLKIELMIPVLPIVFVGTKIDETLFARAYQKVTQPFWTNIFYLEIIKMLLLLHLCSN